MEVLASRSIANHVDKPPLAWTDRITSWWTYPILDPLWVRLCLIGTMILICAARALIGLKATSVFTHDAFMFLDGAWRMMNGQRPHIDFYSHLGVLTYAPTVLGLWLSRGMSGGFGYGQAVVGLVLGLWSYPLSRKYLLDTPAALFCLAVTIMAADPAALGYPPLLIAPAMTYNRAGYAVLALILLEAFPRSRKPEVEMQFLGGFSTGAALAILGFLKITFLLMALFLVAVFFALRPPSGKRWLGFVTGVVLFSLPCSIYLHFHLRAIARDLLLVGHARQLDYWIYHLDEILQNALVLLALIITAGFLLARSGQKRAVRDVVVGGAAICVAGVFLVLGNYESTGLAISIFPVILLVNAILIWVPEVMNDAANKVFLLIGSVIVAAFFLSGLLSLRFGVEQAAFRPRWYKPFDAPVLSDFVPAGLDSGYMRFVNDGLQLLRKYRRPGETVMSLDFTNPFSFALQSKPAPGGTTVLQYNTTFNDQYRRSAEQLFGSADLVMVPNEGRFSDGSLTGNLERLYGGYLQEHFQLVGSTDAWRLFRQLPPRNQATADRS